MFGMEYNSPLEFFCESFMFESCGITKKITRICICEHSDTILFEYFLLFRIVRLSIVALDELINPCLRECFNFSILIRPKFRNGPQFLFGTVDTSVNPGSSFSAFELASFPAIPD